MGAGSKTALLAVAVAMAAAAMLLLAACGEESETEVHEGEPIELGDLSYNVAITRFLNPDDSEDEQYLEGQPEPAPGEQYLAVFMTVENEGDETLQLPSDFRIADTTETTYKSLESDSPYALPLGAELGAGGEMPEPNTPASDGPIKGAMVLFLVSDQATDNRPLEFEIPSSSGDGKVELDI
jgi:hypothetical protein